jgi:hypothetical protein
MDSAQIALLIGRLGSEKFALREQAETALMEVMDLAEPLLRRALADRPSLEVRKRIERLLEQAGQGALKGRLLQAVRAIELLERIGTREARRILEEVVKERIEPRMTQEAKAALARLDRSLRRP